ncbi:hypothetical protein SAMN06265379_10635 [Saccharicrinis carchari]|uniref:Uncharacterized protein n=1 Tax=Saccharicrinis carchari TaxID=1168039 RepID=A0A521DMX1_SACCC|nr:hypothetical protein SAMN06265379_10635 [Saccharicrinis carchari]
MRFTAGSNRKTMEVLPKMGCVTKNNTVLKLAISVELHRNPKINVTLRQKSLVVVGGQQVTVRS